MQLMVQPGAVPSLSTEKFINQSVPLPSVDCQREFVQQVRRVVQRNGRIVQRTQESIERLKEYRSALITAAVTGQIDVATWSRSGATDRRLDAIQEEMGA
ncbi:MAG: restriction endonuclease subunit S [Minwuia sp.]|uniref:restriction endonuclease subunit S n=1 Tax=Minwuia sp. TaxID=2493630 RepID=UPI003A84D7E7